MVINELRQALACLPIDEKSVTGIPDALAAYLSQPTGIAQTRLSLPWIEYRLLAGLALSGWSLRYEIIEDEAACYGQHPRNGTFNRASTHLAQAGLWQPITVRLTTSVTLVRLSDKGRQLLSEIGLVPIRSEWEVMEQTHRGGAHQLRHSAAVCVFACQARRRGYRVTLCPPVSGPAEPDLLLESAEERSFVEVQGRGGERWQRADKWRHAYQFQGEAALCTLTPAQARRYAREAQIAGVARGKITDLQTLYREEPASLWTHRWQSRSGSLLPVAAKGPPCAALHSLLSI